MNRRTPRGSEPLLEIIARLDRMRREAEAAGLELLALLLQQAKDKAEKRLAEMEGRYPPSGE